MSRSSTIFAPSIMFFLYFTLFCIANVVAATCTASKVSTSVPKPSVAPGFESTVVANGFKYPRGLIFDTHGNLLVVDVGRGIEAITFEQDDGNYGDCLGIKSRKLVVSNKQLDHGIELSQDGKTLYASTVQKVFSWGYDASKIQTTSGPELIVQHMATDDHTTRTLLLSKKVPGMLIVTRGSTSNIDPQAKNISSGHSQIKAYNLNNRTGPYDFDTDGLLLGWGLRNDVGIAEEPTGGGLYSVENGVDKVERNGVNIHENNPAEEMNFLGYLDPKKKSPTQGKNFGYPQCCSAWDPSVVPDNRGLKVGMQFAIGGPDAQKLDPFCQNDRIAPTLVFEAHMAPLDIKFNNGGTEAWITFHGSWDRKPPSGYKVVAVKFADGKPVEPSTSKTAAIDIVSNQDINECPNHCFRPVGLAWDPHGRLFFSSDMTGEVYVIARSNSSVKDSEPSSTSTTSSTSSSDESSPKNSPNGVGAINVQSSIHLLFTLALAVTLYIA